MAKREEPNSVFPICKDESEHLEPIKFTVPASYSENIKIHDWQMHLLAEPRDNKDIFPPKGNLQLSTYRRLGQHKKDMCVSETHDMLAQIKLKDLYQPLQPHRSRLRMRTFASSVPQEVGEDDLKLTDVVFGTEGTRCMDYRTTMEIEYRAPYPLKPRAPAAPPPPEPWLLNRRTISYTPDELGKRDCVITFLDDNMGLHRKIAELKGQRAKIRDIFTQVDQSRTVDCPQFAGKKEESQDANCDD